jgi:hypothetical protein
MKCIQRVQKRKDWHIRQTDAIFKKLSPEYRPQNPPLPPYDAASTAEEVVHVPCNGDDGSLCGVAGSDVTIAMTMTMTPVDMSRLVEAKLILAWQAQFEKRV